MKKDKLLISARITRLIILFLHNTISEDESKELDAWIGESDENMDLYEALTEHVDDHVFDPNLVLADTENIIDLWVIAGLIVREKQRLNNQVEKAYLDDWKTSSSYRKKLYKKLQHPAYMQKMLVWNEMKRIEMEIF